MPRYLISFDDGSMDHIAKNDLPAVGESALVVVREAKAAGIWIFGGGIQRQRSSIVAADGTIPDGPVPETKAVVGGFSIIEVATREEASAWATRLAQACQCAQEVREIGYDPESLSKPPPVLKQAMSVSCNAEAGIAATLWNTDYMFRARLFISLSYSCGARNDCN